MKRLIGILLVLLLLLTISCGCNSADVNSDISTKDTVVTSTATAVTGVGETSKIQGSGSKVTSTIIAEENKSFLNENDNYGDLSLETVKKIKQDYSNQLKDIVKTELNQISIEYLTTLSDGSIVLKISTEHPHGSINIVDSIANKYIYEEISDNMWWLYKDGKFASIKEAYDSGVITEKIVDEFFEKYPQFNSVGKYITEDDFLGELTIEQARVIKKSFNRSVLGKKKNNLYVKYKTIDYTDVQLTYYGHLSNSVVMVKFKVTKPIEKETTITEEVFGYKYEHLYSDVAMIYSTKEGGILMDIGFAYERNYVSKTEVDKFFEKLNDLK